MRRHFWQKRLIFGILGLFIAGGIVLLSQSHAATPYVTIEAENGTYKTPAGTVTDSAAAGGRAVAFAAPPAGSGSTFTFASIPDTQREMWDQSLVDKNFDGRWNYLIQNRAALNLQYVWQVGDLQDTDNLIFSSDTSVNPRYIKGWTQDHLQYERASTGLKVLENAKVPFALTVGNHDTGAVCGGPACPVVSGQTQSTKVEVRNTATWNKYYPPARFAGLTTYEAGKTDNAYREFQAGGLNWMVLNLELWPRTEVVNWAKSVVAAHPRDNVVITTHSYLNGGGGIDQSNGGYGANTMQYVFDNLIKQYPNIRFVFSGHTGNADFRTDTGVNGNKIYSFSDCYHDVTNNWMRLLTMDTAKNTVSTKVYAPLTNQTRTEAAANVNISGVSWVR